MTGFRLLLAFSVFMGVFAQECDITAEDIESYFDRVTITNASTDQEAIVWVNLDHSTTMMVLRPGTSKTATSLLATEYTVYAMGPSPTRSEGYHDALRDARDDLIDLTIDSNTPPEQVEAAATDLLLVLDARRQLVDDLNAQTCSGSIESGKEAQVTLTSHATSTGTELWALDCG